MVECEMRLCATLLYKTLVLAPFLTQKAARLIIVVITNKCTTYCACSYIISIS